jgi:hypothetical protein
MAAKARYYDVFRQQNTAFRSMRHYRGTRQKKAILASLIASYALLAAFGAYSLFTGVLSPRTQAADIPLDIAVSIQLTNEKSYILGDTIEADLTVQNASASQDATGIVAQLLGTNNAITWQKGMITPLHGAAKTVTILENTLEIGTVGASDRVTTHLTGTLSESKFPYLAVLARTTYHNALGTVLSVDSNKTYTKLDDANDAAGAKLSLSATKPNYDFGEDVTLELSYGQGDLTQIAPDIRGTITVTDAQGQAVADAACELGGTNSCAKSFQNLPVGAYTALFIGENTQVYSRIASFSVAGQKSQFVPSPLVNLFLPFGSTSINGFVAVHATSVIDQNTDIFGKECTFEVLAAGSEQPLFSVNSPVSSDRSCAANLKITDVKTAGQYTIRLARAPASVLAYFSEPPTSYLPLSLPQVANTPGREVNITSSQVASAVDPSAKTNAEIRIGIFHYRSGEYSEIGETEANLKYTNGNFEANLPSRYFQKGGFYQLFLRATELDKEGKKIVRYSDFVGFSYDVSSTSLTAQGIVIPDYDALVAGGAFRIILSGVTNSSDTTQTSGECLATFYQAGAPGVVVSGGIENGNCTVQVGEGKLTKAGPVLVTFVNDVKEKSINQSRVIELRSNVATTFGVLALEREPANRGFANRAVIGPVMDIAGNLTSSFGTRLQVTDLTDNSVIYTTAVEIKDGFANPIIPAQLFTTPKLKIDLLDASAAVLLTREVEVAEQNYDFVPATFDKTIRSDDTISIKTQVPLLGLSKECSLTLVQTGAESDPKIAGVINEENGECAIDWKPEVLRNQRMLLYKVITGDQIVYSLVSQKPSEPKSPFVIVPAVRTSTQDEVELSLLTSPIVDAAGQLVDSVKMNIEYNAKSREVDVSQGVARLSLYADDLNARTIKTVGQSRYLDIDVEGKVSTTALAKPANIRINITGKDIARATSRFEIVTAQNRAETGSVVTFAFRSENCTARVITARGQKPVQTHFQGQNCYVQAEVEAGKNTMIFERAGFEIGRFGYEGVQVAPHVLWCNASPCKNQVVAQQSGVLEATLYDGVSEYRFKGDNTASLVAITQNGLSGLKDYLVQIKFIDSTDQVTTFYQRLSGDMLK